MATKQRKTEVVTFRITPEQRKMLKRVADEVGKDKGELIRDLVVAEIDKIASLKGWKAA